MGKDKNEGKRSCHYEWFKKWEWLHYSLENDSLFCFPCNQAYVKKKLLNTKVEKSFIFGDGFSMWKNAAGLFTKHQNSNCHKEAVTKFSETTTTKDIGAVISNKYQEKEAQNRKCLMIIIEHIRLLARQGLPIRGDQSEGDEAECNSNFYQFLLVEARKNAYFAEWLKKKTNKYTSNHIQNELVEIMSLEVLRSVVKKIQNANFYSIMADETADISNIEQLSFGVRYVENFEAFDTFIGLHELKNTTADHLVDTIKKILIACNFDFSKIRGQCYDKAASMSGEKSGVKTQIISDNEKALYIHCLNHGLNLAVMETLSQIKLFKNSLSYSEELLILFKKSPKREHLFKDIKKSTLDESPGLKSFSRTRWTVKGESLSRIISNYQVIYQALKESYENETKADMKSRINGVMYQMRQFDFFFSITLAKELLLITDNLAKLLQTKDLSALEGKELYLITAKTIEDMKSEEEFEKFWQKTLKKSKELKVKEPELKRKTRKPARFVDSSEEDGEEVETHVDDQVKEIFRKIFFQALTLNLECLKSRFEQKGLKMYENLQELLLLAAQGKCYDEVLNEVLDFYGEDFDEDNLRAQMKIYKNMFQGEKSKSYGDIIPFFKKLKPQMRNLLSEVCKVLELILVLPASNAALERSFSRMKNIKTRLRSTMTAKRLNHFMIMGHYKEMVDNLDLEKIAAEFICRNENRQKVLGNPQ